MLIEQAVNECNSSVAQRKRDHSDNSAEFKKVNNKSDILARKNEAINSSIESLRKVVELIVEYAKINNELTGQDEADRESIALMGYRDTGMKSTKHRSHSLSRKSPISLDKACLSCSGHADLISSSFKMACLLYTPSPVTFKGAHYDRNELVAVQRKILDGIWENQTDSNVLEISLGSPN